MNLTINQCAAVSARVTMLELDKGFAAKFPFELKDDFRSSFPSAKWNPRQKQWEVGPRSGKRLAQWIDTVKTNYSDESVDEYESHLLTEKELNALLTKLNELNNEIEAKTQKLKGIVDLRQEIEIAKNLISSRQQELDNLKSTIDVENRQIQAEKDRIHDQLLQVVDIVKLKACAKAMAYHISLLGKPNKEAYYEAQEQITLAQDRLRAVGLKLEAIDRLASANKNRPDRDHPKFITDKMWYELSECKVN